MPKSKHREKWYSVKRLDNLAKSRRKTKEKRERTDALFHSTVNHLTNWQRHQWAKKGYPGLPTKVAERVLPFTKLVKVK